MAAAKPNSNASVADADPRIARVCQMVVEGRRAARMLADWVQPFKLSEPEFLVLWCLRDANEAVDQRTIAEMLALSPAQVSATVERLRSNEFIVQQPDCGDRRRHFWSLSPDGRNRFVAMLRDAHGPAGREAAA